MAHIEGICKHCGGQIKALPGGSYCGCEWDQIRNLRAENTRLQEEYALLKSCHDEHYASYLAVCEKLAESEAANERLAALVGQLVSETHGYKPYARALLGERWICVYCEYQWDYDDVDEHHNSDCPVMAAREFMEDVG